MDIEGVERWFMIFKHPPRKLGRTNLLKKMCEYGARGGGGDKWLPMVKTEMFPLENETFIL